MTRVFQIGLILVLACTLQACSAGMGRLKVYNALKENDIDSFKAEVTRIQNDSSYSPEERADRLYDAFLIASGSSMDATLYMLEQEVPIDYPANQPNSTKRGRVLCQAVEYYQPEIVSLLLEHGADPNIELWSIDPRDNILYISFIHTDLIISRILLDGGANPNQWSNPFYPSLLTHYKRHPGIQRLLKEYGGVDNPTPAQRAGLDKGQAPRRVVAKPLHEYEDTADTTIEGRLKTILALKEKGVISAEEYTEARSKILGDL